MTALGKDGWEPLVQRSLEAYQRSGDRVKRAVILTNVGVVCQGEGRWDEAMDYYERGRAEALKIGDTADAALARMNVAEILADRGELTEAEALLLETLRFWRASKYRYFLGYCLWLLGRVALRSGRLDGALAPLRRREGEFRARRRGAGHPGRGCANRGNASSAWEAPMPPSRSRMPPSAARLRQRVWRRWRRCSSACAGMRCCNGATPTGHGRRSQASLAAARTRRDLFETTLTLLALIRLDRREGIEPARRRAARERVAAGAPEGQVTFAARVTASSGEKKRPRGAAFKVASVLARVRCQRSRLTAPSPMSKMVVVKRTFPPPTDHPSLVGDAHLRLPLVVRVGDGRRSRHERVRIDRQRRTHDLRAGCMRGRRRPALCAQHVAGRGTHRCADPRRLQPFDRVRTRRRRADRDRERPGRQARAVDRDRRRRGVCGQRRRQRSVGRRQRGADAGNRVHLVLRGTVGVELPGDLCPAGRVCRPTYSPTRRGTSSCRRTPHSAASSCPTAASPSSAS